MAGPLGQEEIERRALNYCRWQPVSTQPVHASPNETAFSIMSYNLLAQTNLDNHPELYRHCNPDHLEWEFRAKRLIKQMITHNCDIFCLQEVQEEHLLESIAPQLERAGYQYVYKGKTGGKIEGCAVFWRKEIFNILQWSSVEMRVPGCRILNRDNIGLVTLLSPRDKPQAKLVVATTHLLFNPKRGEVKLAQLRYLLAEVEKVAFLGTCESDLSTPLYTPIILCGDFNSKPFCPLYEFIKQGKFTLDGLLHGEIAGRGGGQYIRPEEINVGNLLPCTILEDTYIGRYGIEAISTMERAYTNGFIYHLLGEFQSCYSHIKRDAAEVTSYNDDAVTVDYIFFQNSRLLRHVGTLSLMTLEELQSIGGLPNAAMGSDHLPLAARFILKTIPTGFLQTGL